MGKAAGVCLIVRVSDTDSGTLSSLRQLDSEFGISYVYGHMWEMLGGAGRCPVQCEVIRVHEAHTARIKKRI